MLALTGSLGAMVGNSLGGYLIISLTDSGFSLTAASFIAAVSSVANIIVRIIAGVAADRGKKSPYRYLEFMFVFGMIGTLFLLTNINAIQIIGSILAYAGGWGWAGLLHYVTGAAYPGKERQATAVSQMGVSLGASFGPLIFGCLFSYAGAQIAWISLFIACAVAMITVLIAYRIEYKNSEKNMESVI
jgi:MFS family permease